MEIFAGPWRAASSAYQRLPIGRELMCTSTVANELAAARAAGGWFCAPSRPVNEQTSEPANKTLQVMRDSVVAVSTLVGAHYGFGAATGLIGSPFLTCGNPS